MRRSKHLWTWSLRRTFLESYCFSRQRINFAPRRRFVLSVVAKETRCRLHLAIMRLRRTFNARCLFPVCLR